MSLLYECVNTVIAGQYCGLGSGVSHHKNDLVLVSVFTFIPHKCKNKFLFLSHTAVLISLSSGMPNHSASIQVSV